MSRIYSSPITTSPPLPRQSIFTYLFPSPSGPSSYPTRDPDAPLFIDGLTDRTLSNRDVESGARRLATGLRRLGMKRGDVACVFGYNSLEWLNAVYGCLAAGVVVSTVNYGYTPPEVLHQLKDARVKMCFASPELYPVLIKALELEKSVKIGVERIVLLCEKGVEKPDVSGLRCIEEIWGDEEGEVERFEDGDENETAFVCYSSGTVSVSFDRDRGG